jgi:hypothetical protein
MRHFCVVQMCHNVFDFSSKHFFNYLPNLRYGSVMRRGKLNRKYLFAQIKYKNLSEIDRFLSRL